MDCPNCKRFTEGFAKVVKRLRDRGKFVQDRLAVFLLKDPPISGAHSDFEFVLAKVAEFSDDKGIDGLKNMLEMIAAKNPGNVPTNLVALFADTTMTDTKAINEFLTLVKDTCEGLKVDLADPSTFKGIDVLLNSIQGRPGAKGTYYVMKFAGKQGLQEVETFETAGLRALDLTLKQPPGASLDYARFFECKAGSSIDAGQGIRHITLNLQGDEWRGFRMVINTDDDTVMAKQATDFLEKMLQQQRNPLPPPGVDQATYAAKLKEVLLEVKSRSGIGVNDASFLLWDDFTPPLTKAQTAAIAKTQEMFLQKFSIAIPVQ
jgi:hypothetical protein